MDTTKFSKLCETEVESSSLAIHAAEIQPSRPLSLCCDHRHTDEHDTLVYKWNQTDHVWDADPCLHDLFASQCRRTPEATAIIYGDRDITYAELDAQSQRVASRLIERGIKAQEPVGIVANGTPEAYIGLLGILKVGAAYLPIDPSFPADRIAFFLQQANVRILVGEIDTSVIELVPDVQIVPSGGMSDRSHDRLPEVDPCGLAYVLFTSGSTGKPKGVMLNHRGPVNTVRDINLTFDVQATDRVLALSALGFDLSVYDLFGMFAVGAAVVLPTANQARDPESWAMLINQHRITIWNTVPALMDMLVTHLNNTTTLPSLRLVMLSGDWIPVDLPDRIREVVPQADLISLGGSTEASIWTVMYRIEDVDPDWRSIPYGKPLRNQQCYVVDQDQNLCNIGEVGELCLGGVGVAIGYLNRSDLTEERFIADPFRFGQTLYRTGDLCRYSTDGNLEFLGRQDHQVKIRGYRIGLGEIEAEILKLDVVREAVVIASDEDAGARLIAYVVLNKTQDAVTLAELNAQLCQSLPNYMLPAALVTLSRLPLTSNGKIDRNGLPRPCVERDQNQTQLPNGPTETIISTTLCDLLHLQTLDTRDGFISAGGNSLVAVALVSRLKAAFGVRLESWDILAKSPNTIQLAEMIEASWQSPSSKNKVKPEIGFKSLKSARLSHNQQQLWVEHFLDPNRARYNVPLAYHFDVDLDLTALNQAFTDLICRHHVLRTVYESTAAGLIQRVLEPTPFVLDISDLRPLDQQARQKTLDEQTREFIARPFDLGKELPMRAVLFQLGPNDMRLVVSVHHIAFDGQSIDVMHRDLAISYRAARLNQTNDSPTLAHQYANFSVWQQSRIDSDSFVADREYWRAKFDREIPRLNMPCDTSHVEQSLGETISLRINRDLLETVRQYALNRQSTLFVTMLAAIKATLFRYTGQEDIVIGSAVTARDETETEDLIGYFINVLPLRTRFVGQDTFDDLQINVRETVLGAMAHQNYPFERLKKEVLSAHNAGEVPFRVMFVLENEPSVLEFDGSRSRCVALDTQTAKFDLLISASEAEEYLQLDLQYRCCVFNRTRIENFGIHLQRLLAAAIATPTCPVDQLEILSSDERTALLTSSLTRATNSNLEDFGRCSDKSLSSDSQSVITMFEAQISRYPELAAVRFEDQTLTYAQLDDCSASLAAQLRQIGVARDVPVGIHVNRSIDMLIAMLGVLRAGGCYVPIDPTLPLHRRNQILNDCDAKVILTRPDLSNNWEFSNPHIELIQMDDRDFAMPASQPFRSPDVEPEDIAYVLYTSGSTGTPKGVAMRHGAVCNLIAWQLANSQAGPGTRTLQFASLGFDVSFQEVFATLCSGGELVLVREDLQQDLHQLWKHIVANRIERIFIPFVVLRTLCEIAGDSARHSALREVITAGERLQITPAVRAFFEQLPACPLWNQYGPTETHVVTAFKLDGQPSLWPASPPIGIPIDNCMAVILDAHLQPVPPGINGELYLGGQCLARGYFQNEVLTQQRFVPNPFTNLSTDRLYRTGDICRRNWDGQIEFIQRNDHQIKIRGHRVELSEIEIALSQHANVKQAVVCFDPSGLGGNLAAYVLCQAEEVCPNELAKFVASRLPAYMVPSQICLIDDFPKMASGKIDYQRLSQASQRTDVHESTPKQSLLYDDPLIARLLEIWHSVLGVNQLNAHSDFFQCGGDSLAAAVLFSRLESEFGIALSVTKLVESPTIAELAEVYRSDSQTSSHWDSIVPLNPHGTQAPLFCLPGIDGHLLNFRALAAAIGQSRPVYGLQPYGLDGTNPPLNNIPEIANQHVATIRRVQPIGPYHLAGFSFGGVVAYEMSQQLRRAGEQTTLAIIDASPGQPQPAPLLQSLAFHLRNAHRCRGRQRWKYLADRVVGFFMALQYRFKWITMEQRLQRIINVKGEYAKVAAMNMTALDHYRPTRAEGPATLYRAKFRANWPGKDTSDPRMGWADVFESENLEVVEVEGTHGDMLAQENVARLVEHMCQKLSAS